MNRFVIVGAALLALAACRNSVEFNRPQPERLALGQVTLQEIAASYGRPFSERTTVISAPAAAGTGGGPGATGTFKILNYRYVPPGELMFSGAPASKALAFEFFNDRLIAYNFISSVETDSSNFDDAKVEQLRNGDTTREQIEALLGPPGGRAIFPSAGIPLGEERWFYEHVSGSFSERDTKELKLSIGSDGRLRDYSFSRRVGPPPVDRRVTPIPIIVPR